MSSRRYFFEDDKLKPTPKMFHIFLKTHYLTPNSTKSFFFDVAPHNMFPSVYTYNPVTPRHTNENNQVHNALSCLIHHLHILPTATCSSHQNKSSVTADDDINGNEEEKELSLPGIRMKRRNTSSAKIVGEFEINQLMDKESGWDRVKQMYRMKSGQFEDEGTQALNTMLYRTVIVGFFVNAMVGSLKQDKVEKSLSKTNAMQKGLASQAVLPKKILMATLKDTAKLSMLSLSLLHLSQTISAYKNKTSVWEFTLSSAIGFGAVGISQGVYKCGVFTLGGAVIGSIGGWVVCQVLQSSGLTQESRRMKRMQQRVEENRLQLESAEE